MVELARAADGHDCTSRTVYSPLPVTERLGRVYADRLAALPAETRRAVVCLATVDNEDPPSTVLSWLPDVGDPVWAPAEEAGLVRRSGDDCAATTRSPAWRSTTWRPPRSGARRIWGWPGCSATRIPTGTRGILPPPHPD
ncbi:hypothetical protein OIM90_32030 [Streptomyces sp. AD16]|nr:hypothetical protein OIM90_32030 [Streptomyces sp. AD16]